MIVVSTIGEGEMGCTEETLWTGDDVIRVSEMWFGMTVHTGITCWTGSNAIGVSMIFFRIGVENFSISGALFVATSFTSSGSQKKESLDFGFSCGDVVGADSC